MENASAGKEGGGDLYFVVQPADSWGFPGGSDGKEFACKVGGPGSIPGWGQIPRRRAWQPAPVFFFFLIHGNKGFFFLLQYSWCPGESPWTEEPGGIESTGRDESDTTGTHTRALPTPSGPWRRVLPEGGRSRAERAGPAWGWQGSSAGGVGRWGLCWGVVLFRSRPTTSELATGALVAQSHWEEALCCQKGPRALQALGGQQDVAGEGVGRGPPGRAGGPLHARVEDPLAGSLALVPHLWRAQLPA